MEVICLNPHPSFCNSYLLIKDGDCLLFDPGYNQNGYLEGCIASHKLKLRGIFITHGHFDHFAGLKDWKNVDSAPIFMPKGDIEYLSDTKLNASYLFGQSMKLDNIHPYPIEDEDEIKVGPFLVKAISTPYHTKDGCCYYVEEAHALFSGDSLFDLSIGRDDLPGAVPSKMRESLSKLTILPRETKLYPGHGPSSNIGAQLDHNPYLKFTN